MPTALRDATRPWRERRRNAIPLRPGERPAPPDFIGVGVQKAGTSWWYDLLAAHPRTHRSVAHRKEQHFFDRYLDRPFDGDAVAAYHRRFARPAGTLAGEWTPRYVHDFWVPALLARAAPAAKYLVLLRDPIERYRSGLIEAMRTEPGADERDLTNDALARSRYAVDLGRLFAVAPRDQVLVLQFERCVADPVTNYRATLQFIGYDDDRFVPPGIDRPVRATRREKTTLSQSLLERLHDELDDDVRALRDLCPEIDLRCWPNFSRLS